MQFLLIGFGGFVGAVSRFYLGQLVDRKFSENISLGLLFVNVLGCLIMGMIMSYLRHDFEYRHMKMLYFASFGMLASFTTFSSFSYQTIRFFQNGQLNLALLNVASHVGLGLIATIIGVLLIESFVNFS